MSIDLDFQRRYATTVLELEQLNKDLNKVLHEVQQYCCEVSDNTPCPGVTERPTPCCGIVGREWLRD